MKTAQARGLVIATVLVAMIALFWFLSMCRRDGTGFQKFSEAKERVSATSHTSVTEMESSQDQPESGVLPGRDATADPAGDTTGLPTTGKISSNRVGADPVHSEMLVPASSSAPALTALEMVWIPPGSFLMGSPEYEQGRRSNEGPQTRVTITQGFWMGKYEVTFSQYESVMGEIKPWRYMNAPREQCVNRAVHGIRWKGALQFCERLSQQELASGRLPDGYIYRLPTEAEWEYACRAGTTTRFSFGDDGTLADSYVSYARTFHGKQPDVGTMQPNPWGLYDMHGGVGEMCLDYLGYSGASVTNPVGSLGDFCVHRGGSWEYVDPAMCRSAIRISERTGKSYVDGGFRIVLAPLLPGSVNN